MPAGHSLNVVGGRGKHDVIGHKPADRSLSVVEGKSDVTSVYRRDDIEKKNLFHLA